MIISVQELLNLPGAQTTYAIISTLFGLILGSFFNVLIYRLPAGLSIVFPNSFCPECKRPVRPIENIPVLSYIFLKGRCAGCKKSISLQYPLIELLSGVLALLLWVYIALPFIREGNPWWQYIAMGSAALSLMLLIPVSVIDIQHYIIPDVITLPGIALGIALAFMPGGLTPIEAGLGILAGGGTLLAIGFIGELLFKKEAMGLGDVKLMAFLGAFWGWKISLMAIIFGSFLGSIIGVGLIALRIMKRERLIPFGPFLAAGTLLAIFWGEKITTAYFAFIDRLIKF